ncbi:retropepsin-like aspartic protease family protein [Methylobacterium nodulans]|nr:TIGR02281 family clan AA aspartic protease [Methylobacterium nodulans]
MAGRLTSDSNAGGKRCSDEEHGVAQVTGSNLLSAAATPGVGFLRGVAGVRVCSRCRPAPVIIVLLAALAAAPRSPRAQGAGELLPQVGETLSEFQARLRGSPAEAGSQPGIVTITADAKGHFTTDGIINGEKIRLLVDTGATTLALSHRDAEKIGIRLSPNDYRGQVMTANGRTAVAPITVRQIQIGNIVMREVDAVVMKPDAIEVSLLGMSFLARLSGFETSGRTLTLKQ